MNTRSNESEQRAQGLRRRASAPALIGMITVALVACGDDEAGTETDAADTTGEVSESSAGTGEPAGVRYWQDVAPIYFERCGSCHSEGGIAPFRLDNYADAVTWAEASRLATEARTMPPWLVTSDGSCGEFRDSKALSQEEIDTIAAWIDDGALEGEPRDDLMIPQVDQLAGGVSYTTPEFVPEPEGGIFAEFDEYRCFLIDPALERDRFMTAYDVVPGNKALVHHVLAIPVDPTLEVGAGVTNLDVIEALDAESPDRDGWPCFGAAGDGVEVEGIPVTWAPGQGVVNFPEGTGYRVQQGDLLVVQVHYNMADPEVLGQSDSTTVRVRFEDSVEREGFFELPDGFLESLFTDEPASLPAGQSSVTFTWDMQIDGYLQWLGLESLDVYGVFPHMHEFGRKIQMRVDHGDGQGPQCAADVQRWDFDWQLYYFYEEPLTLGPGSSLEVTCDFNTEGMDEPLWPGWGTKNEMCLMGLFLVP